MKMKLFLLTSVLALALIGCASGLPSTATLAPAMATPPPTQLVGVFEGEYLGQPRPGLTLEPFAPDMFSDGGHLNLHLHTSVYFSPDGQEVYFTHQALEPPKLTILFMRQENGVWSQPQVAPFSGTYDDNCAMFSRDGRRFYFTSNRPLSGNGEPQEDAGIWFVEKGDTGWSEPRPINSPTDIDRDEGTLYFSAVLEGGQGSHDVYRLRFVDGRYVEPENLGEPINTDVSDYAVLTAPDESYLILYRFSPTDRAVRGLHVSFRYPDDSWSETIHLDKRLGLQELGFDASLSPDGRVLFLLDRGVGIYWIDAQVLERFGTE